MLSSQKKRVSFSNIATIIQFDAKEPSETVQFNHGKETRLTIDNNHKQNNNNESNMDVDSDDDMDITNNDLIYQVEAIRNHRLILTETEYYIKWKNQPETANTWYPEYKLNPYKQLIDEYWNKKDEEEEQQQIRNENISRKRKRNEIDIGDMDILDENINSNSNNKEPSQKRAKIDVEEVLCQFVSDWKPHGDNTDDISFIIDIINNHNVSRELINSFYRREANKGWFPYIAHETLLKFAIDSTNKTADKSILSALKTLLIALLNNGSNPMIHQELDIDRNNDNKERIINDTEMKSSSIFQALDNKTSFMDIKYSDLCLFDLSIYKAENISIINVASDNEESVLKGFYFADHIFPTYSVFDEFTLNVARKALCCYDIISIYKATDGWHWDIYYDYKEQIRNMIHDKSKIIEMLRENMNMFQIYHKSETTLNMDCCWYLYLFLLKEYYKMYQNEFMQCFDGLDGVSMDIICLIKDYCIIKRNYQWLDALHDDFTKELKIKHIITYDDSEEDDDDDMDDVDYTSYNKWYDGKIWISKCLKCIDLLSEEWQWIFYKILSDNDKYTEYLLNASIDEIYSKYARMNELYYPNISQFIMNDFVKIKQLIEKAMKFEHHKVLLLILADIGKTYSFDSNLFISNNGNYFCWEDIVNSVILNYTNNTMNRWMLIDICKCIKMYCYNDNNIIMNVMDKLWTKRDWINKVKWTKYRLQCIKILKNELNFNVNKSFKYCYLKQNGKYKINAIKLVTAILKYEANTLFDYKICKENGYIERIKHIINQMEICPNILKRTLKQLKISFNEWEKSKNNH